MFYKNMLKTKLIINMNRQIHFKWVPLKGRIFWQKNKYVSFVLVKIIFAYLLSILEI